MSNYSRDVFITGTIMYELQWNKNRPERRAYPYVPGPSRYASGSPDVPFSRRLVFPAVTPCSPWQVWPPERLRTSESISFHHLEPSPCQLSLCLLSPEWRRSSGWRRCLDDSDLEPRDTTTGVCKGRFSCLPESFFARAAACLSHNSSDLRQISSICSSVKHSPGVVIRYPSSP